MGLFRQNRRAPEPSPLAAERPLSAWRPGEIGVVTEIPGGSPVCCRLREFGVVPGVVVRVLRTACPLIVQVGQERLCVRKKDAAVIRVRSHAAAAPGL